MKTTETKIYLDPFHSEIGNTKTGFALKIYGNTNNGDGKCHIIIINFETWWIKYLVRDFKKIIDEKHKELNDISDGIK